MRAPLPLVAALALLAVPVIAPAANRAEDLEFEVGGGAEISPRYDCVPVPRRNIERCTAKMSLRKLQPVRAPVQEKGEAAKGTLTITYNQYHFDGEILFDMSNRAVGADGGGFADAAWDMRFPDQSRLWGTVTTSKIELGFIESSKSVVFEIGFLVKLGGGSGRYAGLASDCPARGCLFTERVVTPDLEIDDIEGGVRRAAARAAANASDLELGVRPGDPKLLMALPPNGKLSTSDRRRLQLSVEAGSECTATVARGSGSAAVRAAPKAIGSVTAGKRDYAVFPGAIVRSLHAEDRAVSSSLEHYRLRATCTTPEEDHIMTVQDIILARSGQGR